MLLEVILNNSQISEEKPWKDFFFFLNVLASNLFLVPNHSLGLPEFT